MAEHPIPPSPTFPLRQRRRIGREERIDLPLLGLRDVDAKIDTGAYTGAIHCHHVKGVRIGGVLHVRFRLLDPSHLGYDNRLFTLPVYAKRLVKNSFGQTERRYVVQTTVRLFGEDILTQLALADRSRMDYPVLLGRRLLHRRFLVDVAAVNLSHKDLLKHSRP